MERAQQTSHESPTQRRERCASLHSADSGVVVPWQLANLQEAACVWPSTPPAAGKSQHCKKNCLLLQLSPACVWGHAVPTALHAKARYGHKTCIHVYVCVFMHACPSNMNTRHNRPGRSTVGCGPTPGQTGGLGSSRRRHMLPEDRAHEALELHDPGLAPHTAHTRDTSNPQTHSHARTHTSHAATDTRSHARSHARTHMPAAAMHTVQQPSFWPRHLHPPAVWPTPVTKPVAAAPSSSALHQCGHSTRRGQSQKQAQRPIQHRAAAVSAGTTGAGSWPRHR